MSAKPIPTASPREKALLGLVRRYLRLHRANATVLMEVRVPSYELCGLVFGRQRFAITRISPAG